MNEGGQPAGWCSNAAKKRRDWLLWAGLAGVGVAYGLHLLAPPDGRAGMFAATVFRLMNEMWIGLLLGILALGFIGRIPQRIVQGFMGRGGTWTGVLRASAAGLLLDLCNHGILMVAARLYQRGVSYGQVLAFLIASPWNSLSLTIILASLVGLKWTLAFVLGSAVVAILTGWLATWIVRRGNFPANPHEIELPADFSLRREIAGAWKSARLGPSFFGSAILEGIRDSAMILRWLLLGTLAAAALGAFVPQEWFADWFGPTLVGLLGTLAAATVIEVCSEGSVPIAAELLTRAGAPGNSFAFLMAGAATDYTEIAILRDVTKSWKLTFLLPILALPQIVLIGILFNQARP